MVGTNSVVTGHFGTQKHSFSKKIDNIMENNLIRYRCFQYIGNTNEVFISGKWYECGGILEDKIFFTNNFSSIMTNINFFITNFNTNYAFRRKTEYK